MTTSRYIVLAKDEGLILTSGPERDLTFKLTGEDTNGAFDYFIVSVAPRGGLICMSTTCRRRRSTF